MSNQNRNPKGAPASMGGKFAEGSHDEAQSSLTRDLDLGFSVAGREYDIEQMGDGHLRLVQEVLGVRQEVTTFESSSTDEDQIKDDGINALREARGDNLDSAERLELGVGTVTIRLHPGDDNDGIAETLRHISSQIEGGNTSGYHPTWSVDAKKDDEVAASHTVVVTLDGNRAQYTLEEVARLVEDGNTSGYYPSWDIEKSDDLSEEYAEHIAGMFAYSEVIADPEDESGRLVFIRDNSLPSTVYVISVDSEGWTQSATIDRKTFDDNMKEAIGGAEWETGYDA